jgi:hypothetical protein
MTVSLCVIEEKEIGLRLTEDGNGHDESQIDEKELYDESATF